MKIGAGMTFLEVASSQKEKTKNCFEIESIM